MVSLNNGVTEPNIISATRFATVKFCGYFFFLVSLTIPWVSFGFNNWDSQIWPFLAALLFLLSALFLDTQRLSLPRFLLLPLLPGILFLVSAIDSGLFASYRLAANYFCMSILPIAFLNFIQRYGELRKLMVISLTLWVIIAIAQYLGLLVLPNTRTTFDRGVVSLAPEPSFFGIFLFFLTWNFLAGQTRKFTAKNALFCAISLLAILLLAKSSLLLPFFALAFFLMIIHSLVLQRNLIVAVVILFFCITSALVGLFLFAGESSEKIRIVALTRTFLSEGPTSLILSDESGFERMLHIVTPFFGAIQNFLLPGNIETFNEHSKVMGNFMNDWMFGEKKYDKIMSWLGALVYECGIFGLIFYVILIFKMNTGRLSRGFELLLLTMFLLMAIPHAFPLTYLVFAMLIHSKSPGVR